MDLSGNTVLITDGATGIGFRMAEAFVRADNAVLICGRRDAKLEQARRALPAAQVMTCYVAAPGDRERLAGWCPTCVGWRTPSSST